MPEKRRPFWNNEEDDFFGTGGGMTVAAADPLRPAPGTWPDMIQHAERVEAEEGKRYGEGLRTLTDSYNQTNTALSSLVDPNLLFSRASDAVGARARGQVDSLRSSLGARGLNPNSGAASGMLSRIAFEQSNSLVGADRDIALDQQRQRQVNAALQFANALNLAQYQNSPVSGARLETSQNIQEARLAYAGMGNQRKMAREAGETDMLGGVLSFGGSILSKLIGA